jgi:hypothetical protein
VFQNRCNIGWSHKNINVIERSEARVVIDSPRKVYALERGKPYIGTMELICQALEALLHNPGAQF